jgi:type III secretion protein Q
LTFTPRLLVADRHFPAAGKAGAHADAGLVYAILHWNDAPLRVGVPLQACRLWLANRYPDLPLDTLPDPMLDGAVEAMAADVAASLQIPGNSASIVVVEHGKGHEGVAWPHAWTLSASAAPGPGGGLHGTALVSLEMDDAGLARLAHALSYGRPAPDAIDPDQTPVVLRALLGATTLPLTQFQSTGPGDVILLDRYLVDTSARLWLATPDGQGIQVQAQGSQLVIVQGWTYIMNDSINDPDADIFNELDGRRHADASDATNAANAMHATSPLDVDAIPVRLTFDLGDKRVKFGELRAMQVGEIIEQGHPLAEGYVCIRANGAVAGWGELVDIDGRAGVRILRLAGGLE